MPDSTAGSGKFGSISGNRAKISIETRCRKLSPGQGQPYGILIAAEPLSMRPVRNREHRGCARPLSTGHTHVLHQVPFGDDPVLFRAGGHTTPPPGLSPAVSYLGTRCCFFHSLDLHRVRLNPRTAQDYSIQSRASFRISGSVCHFSCRHGL